MNFIPQRCRVVDSIFRLSIGRRLMMMVVLSVMSALYCAVGYAEDAMQTYSPALACLARAPGALEKITYPEDLYESRQGDTIQVLIKFSGPDSGPEIVIDTPNTYTEFVDAVRKFVDGYRLPCMKQGQPVVSLRQEYVFIPNDGRKVMRSEPSDEADKVRRAMLKCMTFSPSHLKPDYPTAALRALSQGTYYVKLTFSAPDQAPSVEWIANPGEKYLQQSLIDYFSELRLPCMGADPIAYKSLYEFKLDGGEQTFIKDMSLLQYLGAMKDVTRPAYFDLDSMGCPFDLRVQYMQPYEKSSIHELESINQNRKPLMDWLATMALNIDPKRANQVLGNKFNLHVPCGKVDL